MVTLETNPAFLNSYIQDNSIIKRYKPVAPIEYVYWPDLIPVIRYIQWLQQDVSNINDALGNISPPGGIPNAFAITSAGI